MITTEALRQFEELAYLWRDDILKFAEILGITPWSQQREFLLDIQRRTLAPTSEAPKRVVAKSSQGAGKTLAMVIAALWRHFRVPGTLTLIVAPTERQAKDVFFAELARVIQGAPPFIRDIMDMSAKKMSVKGYPGWKMVCVTASTPEASAGWHHEHMSVFVEEFSGMDDAIVESFVGTCSGGNNLFVAIGNPTKREGYLYRIFEGGPAIQNEWEYRHTLSKLVLCQENDEIAHPAIVESQRREYGEDSDFWRVRVLGEFPNAGGTSILSFDDIMTAANTECWHAIREAPDPSIRRIGIDFARAGGDQNTIFMRAGNAIVDSWAGVTEPMLAVRRAFDMQREHMWSDDQTLYVPDAVGMGQGLLYMFEEAGKEYRPYGSNYAACDQSQYVDIQTEAWFRAREVLSKEVCALPYDTSRGGLIDQLAARVYGIRDQDGRFRVESKKEYKLRTKMDSPDKADGFIQCFAFDQELVAGHGQVI